MKAKCTLAVVGLIIASTWAAAQPPATIVWGELKHPYSASMTAGGKVVATCMGEIGKDGDGAVIIFDGEKSVPFATGLDDPAGIVAWRDNFFVVDKQRIWRVDSKGKAAVFVAASAFPSPPTTLMGIEVDEQGTLYVTDFGDKHPNLGAIYRIDPRGRVRLVADYAKSPAIHHPRGITMDGQSHLIFAASGAGGLFRLRLADSSTTKLAEGIEGISGLVWDKFGRLYFSSVKSGQVWGIPRPGQKAVLLPTKFTEPSSLFASPDGRTLMVADLKAGTATALAPGVPGFEVDETPLPLETEVAWPKLQWAGWKPENDRGQIVPLRPIILTHAGDGSNRVFVATQQGVIHVFPNSPNAASTEIFLDIQDRVVYNDNTNEEGFLGLAFHPKFKTNGEFFVFYTLKKAKLTNVVSRFRLKKGDSNRADPASEEEIIRFTRPFWNHDGGTICFGPDGHLYIALGDGGAANDPYGNGQNLKTHLGKVLRIDVDHKDPGLAYAVPKDNPFLDKPEAKKEIWAYGVRNFWRMAFDSKTGELWAGEVGQNLYEEINLIRKGGNYGWNRRESFHPFSSNGVDANPDMIDPIWEYHHDIGKSITGGSVYRGKRLPELEGMYLYADYVSGRLWALKYDEAKKRVVANRPIADKKVPVMSFGEDETGEVYFMSYSPTGQGLYRYVRKGSGQ